MVTRSETDERPLKTPSSEESGNSQSCDSPEQEPAAALVVPPDGGWGWVVVLASFMSNFVVDGIIFSGGMLLDAIRDDFEVTQGRVAPVNSLLSGFYLLAGPFVSALANKYGFRVVTIVGSLISSVAFGLSYFANSVEYLYVVYGIIGGIGLCMVYLPSVLTVGFYFEKWRALATGLALCGSGVGTFAMAPFTAYLRDTYGWKMTIVIHAGLLLLCILFGAMFRPIKPVRVTLSDQPEEDLTKKHEEAVEKLNSMLKLQSKLDSAITMAPDMRFNKTTPHTWMGVPNNKQYPTAEEVFKGSNFHLKGSNSHLKGSNSHLKGSNTHLNRSRRSSANTNAVKGAFTGRQFISVPVPVEENEEQDFSNGNIDNMQPLIERTVNATVQKAQSRSSNIDLLARPMYRDDIFFGASLSRLPQYTSRTSLGYHLAVTHVPTQVEADEEITRTCKICPEAMKRTLATMLDVSLFRSPSFVILALSGFFTMLGFFVPYVYLTKRALEQGHMSEATAGWLVSTIGISNIIGRIACGLISSSPKISTLWLNNIAVSAGGIATMASGLCMHEAYQFGYCIIFGLAVACFASLRSILVVEYIGLEQLTNSFGIFLLFQGAGALLGAPIAGALYDYTNRLDVSFYVSGAFLLISAIMCYPVDCISRWEKTRNKLNTESLKV